MPTLDITRHKTNLTNILIDIYKNSSLGPVLGFKGGTAAMLFYNLPRFSVDLDFDLIADFKSGSNELNDLFQRMTKQLSDKYTIKDQSTKYNTLFWLVSYGTGFSHIKVEISVRDYTYNHYNPQLFYGTTVKLLSVGDMIAHKMAAVMERKSTANRDLFDIHYFLSSPYAIDVSYGVILKRTGKEPKEFYGDLLGFVNKLNPNGVVEGMGEVLTQPQKDWAKAKLVEELKGLVQRQIDLYLY